MPNEKESLLGLTSYNDRFRETMDRMRSLQAVTKENIRQLEDQQKIKEKLTNFQVPLTLDPYITRKYGNWKKMPKNKNYFWDQPRITRLRETQDRMTSLQAVMKENIRQVEEDQQKIKEKQGSFQVPLTLEPYITRKYVNWKKMPKNNNYFRDRTRITTDSVRR